MLIHTTSKFEEFKDELLPRIETLKGMYGASFGDPDHDKNLMKGSRWEDDTRIFQIFCGDVIEKVAKEQGLPHHQSRDAEDQAVDEIHAMDQQEIDVMLIEAMRDAAHSDYWYRYEKDW